MERPAVDNRLLAGLPLRDRQHFLSACRQVELEPGEVLCEPGKAIRYVHFPTESYISLLTPDAGHEGLEVALVGSEGMCGISLVLGTRVSCLRAVVQGSGTAWRINAEQLRTELRYSSALQRCLNRYIYVLMSQLAQTAASTRFHLIEARLARCLLTTRDRAHSNQFHATHELLAQLLGVRRVGVTKAAGVLLKRKLISYSRGDVRIHDVGGLLATSCRCYGADKETYEHTLHA